MGAPVGRQIKVATSARNAAALEAAIQALSQVGPPQIEASIITVFDDGTNFNIVYVELTFS